MLDPKTPSWFNRWYCVNWWWATSFWVLERMQHVKRNWNHSLAGWDLNQTQSKNICLLSHIWTAFFRWHFGFVSKGVQYKIIFFSLSQSLSPAITGLSSCTSSTSDLKVKSTKITFLIKSSNFFPSLPFLSPFIIELKCFYCRKCYLSVVFSNHLSVIVNSGYWDSCEMKWSMDSKYLLHKGYTLCLGWNGHAFFFVIAFNLM